VARGTEESAEDGFEPPDFGDFILEALDAFSDRSLDHFHSCNIKFDE
jgi:hypothetical protein